MVKVIAKENLNIVVEKGNKPNIEKKIEIFKDLKLPINKGETVGIVKAVEGENVYGQVEAIADSKIEKMKFIDTLNKVIKSF
ncbi:hypothetical protein PL321_15035 [Caloramator sp. mosi_1]|nr:hypothetical protein [Caloramator sp. mosi_1]WDC85820.1 hypothetical protein PL321_15035 [Caloramator sp. mosi_1]